MPLSGLGHVSHKIAFIYDRWWQCNVHAESQSSYHSIIIVFGTVQDSVLGPLLFALYTAHLVPLIEKHSLHCHQYADDTQVYG